MSHVEGDAIALHLFAAGAARAWVYELGDAQGRGARIFYARHAGAVVREGLPWEGVEVVVVGPSPKAVDAGAAREALLRASLEPASALRRAWEGVAVPRCASGFVPLAAAPGLDEGTRDGWFYARCTRTHEAFAVRVVVPAAAARGEA